MPHYFTRESALDVPAAIQAIEKQSHSLIDIKMLDVLMDRIGDARIVMLGEATHGTHEYYTWRTLITQRLIKEKGFNFLAVEGDWPDCYRLNRYIKKYDGTQENALELLKSFNRWPTWMWANWETVALAEWLSNYNKTRHADERIGFYGLDVYSLWESMQSIIEYLQRVDPSALQVAKQAFTCFEPYRHEEGRGYARASQVVPELCENEVVDLLKEIQRKMPQYDSDEENVFSAEQNALIAVNAEKYYRAMIKGGPHSWNIRDRHMADTLERLLQFHGADAKAIVWEHNTHIGDARATDMTDEGMYNIGELARLKHHEKGVVLVGFGSYAGSVIAGRSWGAHMQRIPVPPAQKDSWEYLLHEAGVENKLLIMDDFMDDVFMEHHIGHRAIGVVYQPKFEQYGNYVPTILPMRYDAFIYLDRTTALHPLHIQPDGHRVPETYPFGM
jgi:erythromycin esterase